VPIQQELLLRLGAATLHQGASVGGRQMHVDHLDSGEFLQGGPEAQALGEGAQVGVHGNLHAISEEGDQDVGVNAPLQLVEDRSKVKMSPAASPTSDDGLVLREHLDLE